MTLTDLFLAQLADPFRIGLLIALIITTMRTVATTGKVIPLLAGIVFVAVLIPTTLSPLPGVTLLAAIGVGLAVNAVILAVLLAGYALFRRLRRG
jgi:multisubunit Na+/H+ antiporter MnhC subunit